MSRIYTIGKPIILAHRGGASEFPENTAESFAALVSRGFQYLETDARATSDGVAVLCHDPTLARTTVAKGAVSSYTWRELSRVKGLDGKPAIMRVDDALDGFPDLIFNIDAKSDGVVLPLVEAIIRTNANERVCVASFSERRLRRIRAALPTVASSLGVSAIARIVAAAGSVGVGKNFWDRQAKRALRGLTRNFPGAQVAQVPLRVRGVPVLTPRFVSLAHSMGLPVQAWTINDVDEAERLLELGVDGIITDTPQGMREALAQRGIVL